MKKVYVGAVDIDIILDTKLDLSQSVDLKIHYEKPNGDRGEWAATVTETTKLKHVTVQGDLDTAGTWKFQSGRGTQRGGTISRRIFAEFE